MKKYYILLVASFIFTGCATYKTKYANPNSAKDISSEKEVSHTFYLIGDAGLSPSGKLNPALQILKDKLAKADPNSTAIFLGDNIYPVGLPSKKKDVEYTIAKHHLDAQLSTLEDFKGQPIFIPGNHDWYSNGLKGLERQQKYIEGQLKDKKVFFPEDGCPIQKIDVNEQIAIIAIDTEWYLTNWDKHPTINNECDIKDREKFFGELEGLIKKNADKTTIIALHHPMFTYGVHGGQFSLKQQFYPAKTGIPLPILGSVVNVLRKTTGASTTDIHNARYRELRKRIVTLSQYSEKVIFTSGHEHTLQYIVEDNTPQIVSGSGAKKGASRLLNGSLFSTGQMGYAVLKVHTDGSSIVRFYGVNDAEKEEFLFASEVLSADRKVEVAAYNSEFPKEKRAAIYSEEETTKSKFFKTIWGERYRKYYSTEVTAPTVNLDTLFGGLKPMRKGGGHQSKSLRMVNKDGKQYVMRALRKSAELYLQAIAFRDQYIIGDFEETFTESILLDFYTGSHPYAPFTIGPLADAIDVFHTNPTLYYVPKQKALEDFNEIFGDELYMIEERTTDGHGDQKSFGYANKMESTDDLLRKLRQDEKYSVDTDMYIRTRLFDMALGDWDRHSDQWRWAEFKDKESGKIVYKPVPRDRDQAFSIMGDGALMALATRVVPGLRIMEGFNDEMRSVKGFNSSPLTYALDIALLEQTSPEDWEKQVQNIQKNLTAEVIDHAFKSFPEEVRDDTVMELKRVLLARVEALSDISKEYYSILNKFAIVTGTDKDDWFMINRLPNGITEIKGYRIKNGKKGELFFNKKFSSDTTKEIWLYALDDDDRFEAESEHRGTIRVRLIGGQNNDIYDIKGDSKVVIHDYKSKKNTFTNTKGARVRLTDDYETNTYMPLNLKASTNQFIPTVGANPDDGFRIGLTNIYTFEGFNQNPFTSQHTVNASFYFATNGFDISYKGEFARVLGNANLEMAAKFTSPNFSINFFGFGNETENFDDDLELDFNRVKLQTLRFSPSLVWRGDLGSKFRTGISYETIDVEETEDRFINTFFQENGEESENSFVGIDAEYTYENRDNQAFPTLGMATSLHFGYKSSTDNGDQNFGYIIPSLSFDYKLVPSGRLVLATKWKAHFNIGDDYEFYQAASIGGVDGLRGFRNQRFTGKTAYYQNTDLRFSLAKKRTGILPLAVGLYGGFDYGRVWFPNDSSNIWHTSYGGGFFLNGADILSMNLALFNSDDGIRFAFGLGFGF